MDMRTHAEVVERSRAHGADAAARALADDLARVDPDRWAELLPVLREVAAGVAPRFGDVMPPEDVAGELALGAWDGWLADWSHRVLEGREHRSLRVFLRDRLRDHLREQRRKRKRRRLLLTPGALGPAVETGDARAPIGTAIFASEPDAPDERLSADELRAAAASDPMARAVVALRERGFSQAEIADVLRVSRPTVTRRVAAIAAVLLAALGALAMIWAGRERPDPHPIEVTELAPDPTHAPAMAPIAPPTPAVLEVEAPVPVDVFVDGELIGRTPLSHELAAGMHVLEAQREGYASYRRVVSLEAGEHLSVALGEDVWPAPVVEAPPARRRSVVRGLERAPPAATTQGWGFVSLNTVPWSRVFVDGRDTGRTTPVLNLRLSVGVHRIGFRTADGQMSMVSVTVRDGETTRVMRSLR